jgi:hypothetical protein
LQINLTLLCQAAFAFTGKLAKGISLLATIDQIKEWLMHRFILSAAMVVLISACRATGTAAGRRTCADATPQEPLVAPAQSADTRSQPGAASKSSPVAPGASAEAGTYMIVKGDTLYAIAKKRTALK